MTRNCMRSSELVFVVVDIFHSKFASLMEVYIPGILP